MMPNLGQGGCQAIEDAYVLTNLLADVSDRNQIPGALQEYYRKRIVRTAIVQGMSRFSSDIIINTFSTPFKFTEFLEKGFEYEYLQPRSLGTWYLQPFLPLIFYAQFGYLYSFAPSNFEESTIKTLVTNSLSRNKAEAAKVYSTLKDGFITYFTAKQMAFMRFDVKTLETSKIADAAEFRYTCVDTLCAEDDVHP